jgi:MFS family permease
MSQRLTGTLNFVAANPRLLAFGFLMPFASAFGQTFFIGLFGEPIRAAFDLSNARFGLLYSLATLCSAATLVWVGRLIDRVDLRAYTAATALAYTGACLLMAMVPPWQPLLFLAFFGLRITGQGLMSHIGLTSMGRYFVERRGTAVSAASMGNPVSEAVFPTVGVALIAWLGWRGTWLACAGAVLLVVLPLALWLLRGHGEREGARRAQAAADAASGAAEHSWRVGQVLRDPWFYAMLPVVLFTPFTVTGLFFHQAALVSAKGWTLPLFANAFIAFALGAITGALVGGGLVDRFGARRLLLGVLAPAALGLTVLALASAPWAAWVVMPAMGLTAGGTLTLQGALWAEVYGTGHLGAVRSMVYAVMVVATAASPVLFGALLDAGVTFETISAWCVAAAILASAAAVPVTVTMRKPSPT